MNDLRFAFRQLANARGFTVIAVLTLGLGVAACAAIFSAVNGVLLRPLPFPDPDRVVVARQLFPPGNEEFLASSGTYFAWQRQAQSFEQMGGLTSATYNLTGQGEPLRLTAMRMTASTLSTFRLNPMLGRNFSAEEDVPGRETVAIVSYGLWQRVFGGRTDVLDKTIQLNGAAFRIIGVMPRQSPLPERWEILTPFAPTEFHYQNFRSHLTYVFGRLKPGVTIGQAQTELQGIADGLGRENPLARGWLVRVHPMLDAAVGSARPALLSLLAAVGFLLLIACANVANLLLARSTARSREMAVRAAMGASRFRIVRQLLIESLLLALIGGVVGVVLAWIGLDALLALAPEPLARGSAPETLPRLAEIAMDGRVLAFALILTLFTGLAFGLAPAFQASGVQLHETLKESGRGATQGRGRGRLRGALVITEVALALVLLTGAGLLMRSFSRLQHENPGFRAEGAVAGHVHLPRPKYSQSEQYVDFSERIMKLLAGIPGVEVVATTQSLPFTEYSTTRPFAILGRPEMTGENMPLARRNSVSPDFFKAMGIPLLRGRVFERSDGSGPRTVIINEFMARRFFPDEDPLGKRIVAASGSNDSREIVGVVGNVKPDNLEADSTFEIYEPFARAPDNDMFFVVRTGAPLAGLPPAIRTAVSSVDPAQPIAYIRPLTSWVAESIGRQRFAMTLFAAFSFAALLLAAIGIYGVTAYSVSQRTGEFGIRIALGAREPDIVRMVLAGGGRLLAAGLVAGLIGASLLTRLLETMLFGVRTYDPVTLVATVCLLSATGVVACLLPAWRAAKVQPMTALRAE